SIQRRTNGAEWEQQRDLIPDEGWRRVHGQVGVILERFGFLARDDLREWKKSGEYRYAYHTSLPSEAKELKVEYGKTIGELTAAERKVSELTAELRRAEAQEL